MGRNMSFGVKQREPEPPPNRLVDMSIVTLFVVLAWVICFSVWAVWRLL